jgi:hypothetical protein
LCASLVAGIYVHCNTQAQNPQSSLERYNVGWRVEHM